MSSCIALARATNLNVEGSDIWKGLNLIEGEGGGGEQENEPEFANIQVQAHFSWNELQLSIHRATTKHFFNIVEKMSEFVMQQKRRSERTLSNMLPAGSAASKALEAYRKEQQKTAEKDSTSIKGNIHTSVYHILVIMCFFAVQRTQGTIGCGLLESGALS